MRRTDPDKPFLPPGIIDVDVKTGELSQTVSGQSVSLGNVAIATDDSGAASATVEPYDGLKDSSSGYTVNVHDPAKQRAHSFELPERAPHNKALLHYSWSR